MSREQIGPAGNLAQESLQFMPQARAGFGRLESKFNTDHGFMFCCSEKPGTLNLGEQSKQLFAKLQESFTLRYTASPWRHSSQPGGRDLVAGRC